MRAVEAVGDGVRLRLHIQPRASKSELAGVYGDTLKIRIAAPPVEDAANQELLRFLAKTLKVSRHQLQITAGHTSKRKTVLIHGIAEPAARQLLGLSSDPNANKEQPTADS